MSAYHDGSRQLQDAFDSRRMADRMSSTIRPRIKDDQREFIERCDMFFIASADAEGRPQCNYKGGEPGFVRVLDDETIAFPNYDGNGMFLTLGNAILNPNVGLLFINFEERRRLRLNGVASLDRDDPLLARYPEGQLIVRVRVTQVFPNCPRYIHHYKLVERSRFVPRSDCETPVPRWKKQQLEVADLPADDPARDPAREVIWKG
jgi:predicted pyridoxine 5'-phosphate oxidase superfamily flavin-nucleotide-binding protein